MAEQNISNLTSTKAPSCGHCFQPIEDPVKLPCDHMFCAQCVQDDYKILQEVKCRICETSYAEMTLEALDGLRLQSVDNSNQTGSVPLSCKIPSCNDPPVIYCEHVKCEKLMCGKHLEAHNNNFEGDGHEEHFVSNDVYIKEKHKHTVKCKEHPENTIMKACEFCYLTFCYHCDRSTPCMTTNDSSWHPASLLRKAWRKVVLQNHKICPAKDLRKKITHRYEHKFLKPINDKVATLGALEKKSWQLWNKSNEHAASLIAKLEKDAEAQIAMIRRKFDVQRQKVEAHVGQNTNNVKRYTSELITQMGGLQALWHQTRDYLDTASDDKLSEEFHVRSRNIQASSFVEPRDPPHLPTGSLVSGHGSGRSKELIFSVKRQDIQFHSQYAIKDVNSLVLTNTGITVCAASSGNLSMVDVFDQQYVINLGTKMKWHSLSVDDNGNVVGLGKSQITAENCVKLFTPAAKRIEALFSYPNSWRGQRPDQIGILRDYESGELVITGLIVMDSGDRSLSCFNTWGDNRGSMSLPNMSNPRGLCTINGNFILISDCSTNGSLTKYHITKNGELKLIWMRDGLDYPASVCVDQRGNIYVASQGGSAHIYLLSEYGDIIAELRSSKLEAISDIYVCGDFLAVALQHKIQLYKLITTC